ncbi:hypothetical protein Tco_0078763 [Tanacetum coccineum]
MPTRIELKLEQTQQGVSYEVSVFTMKMEILLEPTSNKLMVAGNPVNEILLKLNLSDHRILKRWRWRYLIQPVSQRLEPLCS